MKLVFLLHLCLYWITFCNGESNCVPGSNEKIDKWKVTSILVSPFLMEGKEETPKEEEEEEIPTTVAVTTPAPAVEDSSSDASNSTDITVDINQPKAFALTADGNATDDSADTSSDSSNTGSDTGADNGSESSPVQGDKKEEKDEEGGYSGYIVDLLDRLAEALQVTYEISLVPDNRYGKKDGDKWNGLIGQVCDGKAHIAAAPITVTVDREEAVDFTYALLEIKAVAVIKNPSESFNSLQSLLNSSYQLGIWRESPILKLMAESKTVLTKQAYTNIQKGLVDSNKDGFAKLRKDEKYAYIVEDTVANYVVNKPPCGLKVVNTNLYTRKYAFAVAQGSPLRDQINKVIVDWQIDGTLEELQKKWWGDDECSGSPSILKISSFVSLSLAAFSIVLSRFL